MEDPMGVREGHHSHTGDKLIPAAKHFFVDIKKWWDRSQEQAAHNVSTGANSGRTSPPVQAKHAPLCAE
jgi:hypothetical protein